MTETGPGAGPGRGWARRAALGLVGTLALSVLVGLGVGLGRDGGVPAVSGAPDAAAEQRGPRPVVTVGLADGATGVDTDASVRVAATGGTLAGVRVTGPEGDVPGSVVGGSWRAGGLLHPGTGYVLAASAVGPGGAAMTTVSFTTVVPTATALTRVQPLNGETVGVGMPVVVQFTAAVADRTAALAALSVTSDPVQEGAWRWTSAREVHWRPREYWQPGTTVVLSERLDGVALGDGVYGGRDREVRFTIGASHVSTVDATTHTMTVRSGGKVVRTFPVSTGRDAYPTTSGTHLVLEKNAVKVMDSSTVGIPSDSPEGYVTTAKWSTRISYSGEFVHAAPWSVASQGRANVSHGCVNASTADAEWFFTFSRRGDVVTVTGTPRPLRAGNGLTDWIYSWEEWTAPA